MQTAYFNRFFIELPDEAVTDCSHQGQCDEDVAYWVTRIPQLSELNPSILAMELKEYGAWDAEELADHEANLRRILWIAAGNIREELASQE